MLPGGSGGAGLGGGGGRAGRAARVKNAHEAPRVPGEPRRRVRREERRRRGLPHLSGAARRVRRLRHDDVVSKRAALGGHAFHDACFRKWAKSTPSRPRSWMLFSRTLNRPSRGASSRSRTRVRAFDGAIAAIARGERAPRTARPARALLRAAPPDRRRCPRARARAGRTERVPRAIATRLTGGRHAGRLLELRGGPRRRRRGAAPQGPRGGALPEGRRAVHCFRVARELPAGARRPREQRFDLVNAVNVFLLEQPACAAVELQCVNRVHRVGQTLPTTVYRYVVKDTIEDANTSTIARTRRPSRRM